MLYEALAPLGFTPRQIDEMEVWEAATILRRYEDDGNESGDGSEGHRSGGRDLVAERLAAAAGQGPAPLPSPPTGEGSEVSTVGIVDLRPDVIGGESDRA